MPNLYMWIWGLTNKDMCDKGFGTLRSPLKKCTITHYPPLYSTRRMSTKIISKIYMWINLWITIGKVVRFLYSW
jgi:hypothetical protein